jgi:hypothetical protein
MFFEVLIDIPLTQASQRLGKINLYGGIGNGRKRSDKPLSPYAKRLGMIALVLAVACMARDSIAQTAKESIDVPPHSRLLLRADGSGDQVYGCVNDRWALKARMPSSSIKRDLSLDDTLQVLRGSSMMVVG